MTYLQRTLSENLMSVLSDLLPWLREAMVQVDQATEHARCELLFCAHSLGLAGAAVSKAVEASERKTVSELPGARGPVVDVENYLLLQRFSRAAEWRKDFLRYWVDSENYKDLNVAEISGLLHCVVLDRDLASPEAFAFARSWLSRHRLRSSRMEAFSVLALSELGDYAEANIRARDVLKKRQKNGSWDGDVRRTIGCLYPLVVSKTVDKEDLDKSLLYILDKAKSGVVQDTEHRGMLIRLLVHIELIPVDEISQLRDSIALLEGVQLKNAAKGRNIFLCHAHEDKKQVQDIYLELKKAGFRPWMDKPPHPFRQEGLLPGSDWDSEIRSQMKNADFLFLCLSKVSVEKKGYVQREYRLALNQATERPSGDIFLIPVLLEKCDIPSVRVDTIDMQRFQWFLLYEDGIGDLIAFLDTRLTDPEEAATQVTLADAQNRAIEIGIYPLNAPFPSALLRIEPGLLTRIEPLPSAHQN